MIQKIVAATTHIDRHFMKITKEALEDAAEKLNSGRKIPYLIEHDLTIPPLGKSVNAWVEPREDGEYQLVIEHDIFEGGIMLTNEKDDKLIKQESKIDNTPFVDRYAEDNDDLFVTYDFVNFASKDDLTSFIEEIKSQSEQDISFKQYGRKSYIPEPELFIGIGISIATFLLARFSKFGKNVADKAGEKVAELVAEDVASFYKYVRSVAISSSKYLSPKNRPTTYIFVLRGVPTIEFIIKTEDPELVTSAIKIENLNEALPQAENLYQSFKAEKIQFLFEDGHWKFNYLLTDTGGVIGTRVSFSKSGKYFDSVEKQVNDEETKHLSDEN